jgi:hypothetical protein
MKTANETNKAIMAKKKEALDDMADNEHWPAGKLPSEKESEPR